MENVSGKKIVQCAYEHNKSDNNIKIEILENEVRNLTNEIKQLNSNMSEIMIKMTTFEESEKPNYNVQQKSAPKEDEPNSEYLKCNEYNFSCETNHALTIHEKFN